MQTGAHQIAFTTLYSYNQLHLGAIVQDSWRIKAVSRVNNKYKDSSGKDKAQGVESVASLMSCAQGKGYKVVATYCPQ